MRSPSSLLYVLTASTVVLGAIVAGGCGDDFAQVTAGEIADIEDVAFLPTQVDRSSQQQFRIRNNGDGDLIVANVEIVDASPYIRFSDGFLIQMATRYDWQNADNRQSWVESPPFVLGSRREIQVDVEFAPETQDPMCPGANPTVTCGTIVIESDDRNEPRLELNITLNQSAGSVSVDPTVLDFPDVTGGPYTESFTITNIGSGPLTGVRVTDPGVNGLTLAETTNRPEPFTLQPADESTYDVTFSPVSGVDYCPGGIEGCTLGSIIVNSNDSRGQVVSIIVRIGQGSQPDVAVSTDRLEFNTAAVGSPETLTVDVSNEGGANLTWNLRVDPAAVRPNFAIEVGGTARPASGSNIDDLPIAPDNAQTVSVTLDPTTEDPIVGELVITSNDDDERIVRVDLYGGAPAPDLNVEPSQIVFQGVGQGESADAQLVLANPGRTTLTISSGAVNGPSAAEFSVDPALAAQVIAPSGRLPVRVTYDRPGDDVGGLDQATLQIVSDALEPNDTINVPLFAQHGATALPPTAEIDVSPEQGTYSVDQTITLDASASEPPEDGSLPANPYNWVILERPSLSDAELTSSFEAQTSITPDLAGTYTILLTVTATIDMTTSTQAQRSINLLVE